MTEPTRPAGAHAGPRSRRTLLFAAVLAAFLILAVVTTIVVVRVAGGDAEQGAARPDRITSSPTRPVPTSTSIPTPTPSPTATAEPEPPAEEPEPAPPPAPVCSDDVLVCVNIARAEHGLGALSADGALNAAAQNCADRMAGSGELTHSSGGPGGFSYWGENIAVGYPSAAAVFEGWMGSEGHRANILNPNYTSMGIGYAPGNWWCQQFGG